MSLADRFSRLPTGAKLLLILTALLFPIGIGLTFLASNGIRQASAALEGRSEDQERAAAQAVESLIARNALALRIAANGAFEASGGDPCERARKSVAIAPAVAQSFELEAADGKPICSAGQVEGTGALPIIAPGDIRARVSPVSDAIAIRTGVNGGMATAIIPVQELRTAALQNARHIRLLMLRDGDRELRLIAPTQGNDAALSIS